jgi:hypothetical protein
VSALALLVLGQSHWRTYTLGGISLSLPVAPKRTGGPSNGAQAWNVSATKTQSALITCGPAPKGSPEASLTAALDRFANRVGNRLLYRKDRRLRGWPALAATIQIQSGDHIHLLIARSDKILIVVAAGEQGKPNSAFAKRLLDSVAFAQSPKKP